MRFYARSAKPLKIRRNAHRNRSAPTRKNFLPSAIADALACSNSAMTVSVQVDADVEADAEADGVAMTNSLVSSSVAN